MERRSPPAGSPRGTIRLVQTTIGDYRQAFLEILVERLGDRFEAFTGDEYFDGVTRTRVDIGRALHRLGNHFLLGRRLLWQTGAVTPAVRATTTVLELNPRILSVWVIAVLRRLLGRRTLMWGHAWSRRGRTSSTNVLRGWMRRLADGVIVYTHRQADELRSVDDRSTIYVAPNALYRKAEMHPLLEAQRTTFLFVGRLVPAKRPDLLLDAFKGALDRLPPTVQLVFVGSGDLEADLRRAASHLGSRVVFQGHVADPERLRRLYGASIASVSPGFVGLSITQSLGYGVPMIIARDEPHSPEIEAAVEGWNAWFFSPSSAEALAAELVAMASRDIDPSAREAISRDCRERYSAEAMADGFIGALSGVDTRAT